LVAEEAADAFARELIAEEALEKANDAETAQEKRSKTPKKAVPKKKRR